MSTASYFHVRIMDGGTMVSGIAEATFGEAPGNSVKNDDGRPFASWRWDGKRVQVEVDRYGIYPLFYTSSEREFIVASAIETLLHRFGGREINAEALAIFLRLGYFLDEDTPFRRVFTLPPAGKLIWQGGRLTSTSSRPKSTPLKLSRSQAIDGYIDLFRQAIARRLPNDSDFCLPLSGGRDSRHILFELSRAGRPPRLCVTVDRKTLGHRHELEVAARVATAVHVKHVRIGPPWSGLISDRWAFRVQHYCADEGGWYRPCADFLNRGRKFTYDGLAGDMWAECYFNTAKEAELLASRQIDELADHLLVFWRRDAYAKALLNEDAYRAMHRECAVARLSAALSPHSDTPNPLASFYFWNRTRREVALLPLTTLHDIRVHFPYLDSDVFDFVCNLPPGIMQSGNFHSAVIAGAYGDLADLPYADRPSSLPGNDPSGVRARNWIYVGEFLAHAGLISQRRIVRSRFLSSSLLSAIRGSSSVRFARRAMSLALYFMELEDQLTAARPVPRFERSSPMASPDELQISRH